MKNKKQIIRQNTFTEFLLYTAPNGKVKVEIFLKDENIWLTQKKIAELFEVEINTINEHLKNIFSSGELDEISTIRNFRIVQKEGSREIERELKFYNLDAIISVGYRVNSAQATQFRIWATERLKEYIIKGFTMDDERLKNPNTIFGHDYFEEQLARIRDIRSSERRLYQKITDIYAQCSADYSPNNDITKQFFAIVQNKLHFAITEKTAAEIISERVDSKKPNIGLTTWKYAPTGKIREMDVVIAKNYLNEKELNQLNRIVTMYLDYAEMQAQKGIVIYMKDWVEKLNAFLKFNERDILNDSGKISHEVVEAVALEEYDKYRVSHDKNYISDFDKEIDKHVKVIEGKKYMENTNMTKKEIEEYISEYVANKSANVIQTIIEYLYVAVNEEDVENVDNFRIAKLDDLKEMAIYEKLKEDGCCGSSDNIIDTPDGKYMVGFNYGH